MAKSRSRISGLRAPLVVTVALGGVAGACGGVSGDSSCPVEAPTTGASCTAAAESTCGYGDCYGSPTIRANCANGKWNVSEQSCNPPPPSPPPPPPSPEFWCPAAQPTRGTSCPSGQALPCEYGDCGGTPTVLARCANGSWSVVITSCNPPAPPSRICPPEPPLGSGYCNYSGPPCAYGECRGEPAVYAMCESGMWTLDVLDCTEPVPPLPDAGSVDAAPSACPTNMPWHGDRCPVETLECEFGSCYGTPTGSATCRDARWSISFAPCNPPPVVPGCLYSPPANGDPCTAPDGLECVHGGAPCSGSPGLVATCSGGTWTVRSSADYASRCGVDAGASTDAGAAVPSPDGGIP